MGHLLVTNDFPPKLGGIQSYLYELWRRLPPEEFTVFTTAYDGAAAFDRAQSFRVVRSSHQILWPTPGTVRSIRQLAGETGAGLVVLDPAMPIGLVGRQLGLPYAVVVHGAEVTLPGRLVGARQALASVLGPAALVVAAGGYPEREARRANGGRLPPTVVVPPGVDHERFHPLDAASRGAARARFGLATEGRLVVSVSRLVPRKGMDVLIRAVSLLRRDRPDLQLAIGGAGRDRRRLEHVAGREGGGVTWLGRVPEEDLPLLYGAGDVFAMCCRNRWLGLEQEGFGMVFLEAAACGVPQVAGLSGGADEAVVDGVTGAVVGHPDDPHAVAAALAPLLDDPDRRRDEGLAARRRAVEAFDFASLAERLRVALAEAGG